MRRAGPSFAGGSPSSTSGCSTPWGGLVAEWAARWGVEFKLPVREVVLGTYTISRGMGLETLLADEPGAMGLIEGRAATNPPREGRLP